MAFGLLPSYCSVWFIRLLRSGAFCCLVAALYLCEGNSNKQSKFGQIKVVYILES